MNPSSRKREPSAGISGPFTTRPGRSACARARTQADNLPYALWGAVLLLCAFCFAFSLPGHGNAGFLTGPAPGYTIPAPHVGAMRVIPMARAALLSPCAAWEAPPLLAEASARL